MPKQRPGVFYIDWTTLHTLRSAQALKQGSQKDLTICTTCPQLQPGKKNNRSRWWWMVWQAAAHPHNQPGDLSCSDLLQPENCSKLHLALQHRRSMEGAKASRNPWYKPVPSELTPAIAFSIHCPCLCSSRHSLKVQSAASLFPQPFALVMPAVSFHKLSVSEVQRAEISSSKTWKSATERGKQIKAYLDADFLSAGAKLKYLSSPTVAMVIVYNYSLSSS